jgi:hypothetical protein
MKTGIRVAPQAAMPAAAFQEGGGENENRDDCTAPGIVEPPPDRFEPEIRGGSAHRRGERG